MMPRVVANSDFFYRPIANRPQVTNLPYIMWALKWNHD